MSSRPRKLNMARMALLFLLVGQLTIPSYGTSNSNSDSWQRKQRIACFVESIGENTKNILKTFEFKTFIFVLQKLVTKLDVYFLNVSHKNSMTKQALSYYDGLIFLEANFNQVKYITRYLLHNSVLFVRLAEDGFEIEGNPYCKLLQIHPESLELNLLSWLHPTENLSLQFWGNCTFSSTVSKTRGVDVGKKFLSGRNLKVSSLPLPPYMSFPEDSSANEQYSGLVFEIVKIFSQHLNFTYKVSRPPDGNFGGISNGTWNGIVGQVMRNETELGVAPFTVMYERAQVINFVWPVYEETSSLLIPANQEQRTLWAFMLPYHNNVWLCLILALLLVTNLLWLISKIVWACQISRDSVELKEPPPGLHYLFAIGVVTNQAGTCTARTHSTRVLAATWCLAAVILVYTYTSTLISNLTVPKTKPILETLEELATGSILLPTVLRDSSYDVDMLQAKSGPFKGIGDLLRTHPKETRVASSEVASQRVLTGKYAFIIETPVIEDIISQDWIANGKCRLAEARKSRNSLVVSYFGVITHRHAIYNPILQYTMQQLHEHGLVEYCVWRSHPSPNPCSSSNSENHAESLQLKHVESAFFLLAVGTSVSFVIFMFELGFIYYADNRSD